jgi:hypothetical protein
MHAFDREVCRRLPLADAATNLRQMRSQANQRFHGGCSCGVRKRSPSHQAAVSVPNHSFFPDALSHFLFELAGRAPRPVLCLRLPPSQDTDSSMLFPQ